MKISIIAAVGMNGAIGKDNNLLWRLPDDMKFFRDTTLGHHVIMGRKNWESIPHNFRPLPERTNIVVSRDAEYVAEKATVVQSIEAALEIAHVNGEDEAFIIGGGEIYKMAMENNLASTMYITHVRHSFEADVYFPPYDPDEYEFEILSEHQPDEKHDYEFVIVKYTKK